jgi:uncharacterized membrane protein YuzA (DUF378 family)
MSLNTVPDSAAPLGASISALDWIALLLAIIGGLNWGLVGLLNVDFVATVLGPGSPATRVVYGLVGLAAIYLVYFMVKLESIRRS